MSVHTEKKLDLACLDDVTITHGAHADRKAGTCVMELVAWVAGEPHTDRPACVSPVIAAFLRRWNDDLPTDEDRDRLLKPLIPVILNTASTPEVEARRVWRILDWLVRTHTPAWFDLVPALSETGNALRNLPSLSDESGAEAALPTIQEAGRQSAAAGAAARAAAWAAGRDAAGDAAGDAAWAAAWAAGRDAARDAAWAAARDAAGAAAWDAAWDAAGAAASKTLAPTVMALQESAVELVRALAEMGTASEQRLRA